MSKKEMYTKKMCLDFAWDGMLQGFDTTLLTLHAQIDKMKEQGADKQFMNGYITAINIIGEVITKSRTPERAKEFKDMYEIHRHTKQVEEENNKSKIILPNSEIKVIKK